MYQIQTQELLNRVVTNSERVDFSSTDPYGHLSTCRYLEYFVNHRITAIEDEIGFATMSFAKEHQIGLFFAKSELHFLRQAILGEKIMISSWVQSIHESGFQVTGIVYGGQKRDVKAIIKAEIRSVSLLTGKSTLLPNSFAASSETLIKALPLASSFIQDFKIPQGLI